MVDLLTLAAFVPAALALNLTPGADMMFCLGQGIRSGPRAAWAASAGITVGGMFHVILAGLGLSTLVAQAPGALEIIRWIGVGYLLWLAYQTLHSGPAEAQLESAKANNAFLSGLLVNLTNPKVILFVLAFVPQFVVPTAGPVLVQFIVFGAVIGIGGFIINGCVGVFAGTLGRKISRGSRILKWLTAGVFVGLATRLAILEKA